LAFSIAMLLFQMSCKKEAIAVQTLNTGKTATTTTLGSVMVDGTSITVDENGRISTLATTTPVQQNKIIYTKNLPIKAVPGQYQGEIWSANYDGSNKKKINIVLPAGLYISYTPFIKLSPDQKTIFFRVVDTKFSKSRTGFYSSKIDGTGAKLVIPEDGAIGTVEVAY